MAENTSNLSRQPATTSEIAEAKGSRPEETHPLDIKQTPVTKASMVGALLARPEGALLADLCEATGWLPHTCRAHLTGMRKKGAHLARHRRDDGQSVYRMLPAQGGA